jgi:heme A synthase
MDGNDARKTEPLLLAVQFLVCVGCWTVVVLALEGTVSRSGFVASIVTGILLVVITVLLVKLGWILAPAKPAEIVAEEER